MGQASKKQTINISPGPEKSLQPKIKVISESSLNLMWQPQPNIKGYRILVTTVELSDPTRIATPDKVVDLPGSSNHYKSKDFVYRFLYICNNSLKHGIVCDFSCALDNCINRLARSRCVMSK